MLAIGGWNEGSTRFSPLVADEERRAELVHNVVRFLRQNHFDGLDLDWEYPAFRDGGKPRDRDNYALLVQVSNWALSGVRVPMKSLICFQFT
jgi:chitinase